MHVLLTTQFYEILPYKTQEEIKAFLASKDIRVNEQALDIESMQLAFKCLESTIHDGLSELDDAKYELENLKAYFEKRT
jgi:hypothetical protein